MYMYISTDGRLPIYVYTISMKQGKSGVFAPGFHDNVLQVCPDYLAR